MEQRVIRSNKKVIGEKFLIKSQGVVLTRLTYLSEVYETECLRVEGGNGCSVWSYHINNVDYLDVVT